MHNKDPDKEKVKRFWKLLDPYGNEYTTHNLKQFFTRYFGDKAINAVNNASNKSGYKGWRIIASHKDKKTETEAQNKLMVVKPSSDKDTYILEDPEGNKHTTHSLHEFFIERFGDGFQHACISLRRKGKFRGWTLLEEILAEDKDIDEEEYLAEERPPVKKKVEKFWELRDPDGKVHTVKSLLMFFRDYFKNEKQARNAMAGIYGNRKYMDWSLIKCHLDEVE